MDEAVTRRTTPAAFNGPLEAGLRAVVLIRRRHCILQNCWSVASSLSGDCC